MIPTVFGSVTPSWAGLSPGPGWPGHGSVPLSSFESGPASGAMGPLFAAPLSTPVTIPGTVTAPAVMAAVATRRGQPHGPATDQDVEEFIYDALEWLPGATEVEVRCEGGRVSLTGSAAHKRIKRDVGEIAWAIPAIVDVNNTIAITARRRSRAFSRDSEAQPSAPGRKQA